MIFVGNYFCAEFIFSIFTKINHSQKLECFYNIHQSPATMGTSIHVAVLLGVHVNMLHPDHAEKSYLVTC